MQRVALPAPGRGPATDPTPDLVDAGPPAPRAAAASTLAATELDALYEVSPFGLATLDLGLRYLRVNARLAAIHGLPADAHTGRRVHEVAPAFAAHAESVLARVLETGGPVRDVEFVGPLPGRPDAVRTLVVQASPLRDAAGAIAGLAVVVEDATERRGNEASLRDSEAKFRTLADNIPQLAWMTDAQGAIHWYNRRWFEYTGTTPEAMLGWGWRSVHHPDHVERVVEKFRAHVASGEPWEDTFPMRGADGGWRWFLSRAFPVRNGDGTIAGWFGTNTDVTAQRDAQEALRVADRRKDEFLAMLAHELRNPLAPLRTGLRLLEREALGAVGLQALAISGRQVGQLARLVDDLLEVSRITRGKIALQRERVLLQRAVREVVETLSPTLEERAQTLTLGLPETPVVLDVDAVRFAQVLENLLSNASKYTNAGGSIRLDAQRDADEVTIRVTDTGIGIAAEHLPRVFELFSQVDASLDRARGGLGIGLALVRQLVLMHGGRVTVHSDGPGRGSTFTIALPCGDGG